MARQAYRGELEHLRSMHVKAVDERNELLDAVSQLRASSFMQEEYRVVSPSDYQQLINLAFRRSQRDQAIRKRKVMRPAKPGKLSMAAVRKAVKRVIEARTESAF